jgi:hypothetical protein
MKLSALTSLTTLVAVTLPVATAIAANTSTESINWLVLFFAFTTFYSEGLAAIPAIKANAIYQQIGQVLNFLAKMLRGR